MADNLISGEEDLISGDEEDLTSGEEDLMSGDENYLEASSSMPVPAQTIHLISQQNLLRAQRGELDEGMKILDVKEQHAGTLLIHHQNEEIIKTKK